MLREKLAGWAGFGVELGFGPGKLRRIEIFCIFEIFYGLQIHLNSK
jgi:hypothetical protein